jgi:hypothetical protein
MRYGVINAVLVGALGLILLLLAYLTIIANINFTPYDPVRYEKEDDDNERY